MSTNYPGDGQPEYLGPADLDGRAARGGGRRRGVVVGAAVAVVAAVGVGGYGLVQLMAGGSSPASAVPANALGYVSLDLDPSASQKIEAFRMLRRFPALKHDLHLGGQDDIRRAVFDQVVEDGGCKTMSYSDDVEPWIGNRVAFAAIPDAKKVVRPLVTLQVTDQAKAKKGIEALQRCGDSAGSDRHPVGISFAGDYALVTDDQAAADAMAEDAGSASLADDPDFKTWTARAGDPGIVTMYASKDVPGAIVQGLEHSISADVSGFSPDEEFVLREKRYVEQMTDRVNKAFAGFEGAAGTVRFHGGAVEADFATKGARPGAAAGAGAGRSAAALPSTTAAALSLAVGDGWVARYLGSIGGVMSGVGMTDGELWGPAEKATGLQLPEDLETMLGHGFTVSIDSSVDLQQLEGSDVPAGAEVGVRIQGDPDEIVPIIDKLKKSAGPDADAVEVARSDDAVAVSFDAGYAAKLLDHGTLGDQRSFRDVVPHADKSSALLFVDFDANDWANRLADAASHGDPKTLANIAPLDALGVSGWVDDGGVTHASVRLTTD